MSYSTNYDKIDWSKAAASLRPSGARLVGRPSDFPSPQVIGDLPEYISPVTGKPVDGRVARREDLKRSGCREVDPSEFKPEYRSKKLKQKYGKKEG